MPLDPFRSIVAGARVLPLGLALACALPVLDRGTETRYRIGGETVEDRMHDFGVFDAQRLDIKSITTLDYRVLAVPLLGERAAAWRPLTVVGDSRTPARVRLLVPVVHAALGLALIAAFTRLCRRLSRRRHGTLVEEATPRRGEGRGCKGRSPSVRRRSVAKGTWPTPSPCEAM